MSSCYRSSSTTYSKAIADRLERLQFFKNKTGARNILLIMLCLICCFNEGPNTTRQPHRDRRKYSLMLRSCANRLALASSRRIPLTPIRILTEVQHGWNKTPSDDKLAALEQLLQPLFALFAQFSHVMIPNRQSRAASKGRKKEVTLKS